MRYSIEDTTLTALGDATRKFVGETRNSEIITSGIGEMVDANNEYSSYKYVYHKAGDNISVVKIPGAINIIVRFHTTSVTSATGGLNIAPGELETIPNNTEYGVEPGWHTVKFENVDAVTFNFYSLYDIDNRENENTRAGYYAEVQGELKNTLTPVQMAEEINNMMPGPTAEELTLAGTCQYGFSYNCWNWLVEKYGNQITTKDISNSSNMFYYSSELKEIPFDFNFLTGMKHNLSKMFYGCRSLTNMPKFIGASPSETDDMFYQCQNLREIPLESIEDMNWSYIDTATSAYDGYRRNMFQDCYSLRSVPMEFLNHGNPIVRYNYSIYKSLFSGCYVLDEVIGLPLPHTNASWTSNAFTGTFNGCYRLKNITFAVQEDGSPYVCSGWKGQTIDLSGGVGHGCSETYKLTDYNSGITSEKLIRDDETYQALKDDPDWYCSLATYSRYNHDSAVATINSLPDCSALGGNTIKFTGTAGSATDGGAINTLTEEEIAVAAAKGWTVTLV